jgi:hypothetical protein
LKDGEWNGWHVKALLAARIRKRCSCCQVFISNLARNDIVFWLQLAVYSRVWRSLEIKETYLGAPIPYHDKLVEGGGHNIGACDFQRVNMHGEMEFQAVLFGKNLEAVEHGGDFQLELFMPLSMRLVRLNKQTYMKVSVLGE